MPHPRPNSSFFLRGRWLRHFVVGAVMFAIACVLPLRSGISLTNPLYLAAFTVSLVSLLWLLPFIIAIVGLRRQPDELLDAIADQSPAWVRKMLARGISPNAANLAGRTALMLAAGGGNRDLVRLLLESGADPYRRDGNGRTAWQYAGGCAGVLDILAEYGPDPGAAAEARSRAAADDTIAC